MRSVIVLSIASMFMSTSTVRSTALRQTRAFQPALEVHALTTRRDGGIAGTATGGDYVVVGQPIHWFVFAGMTNPGEMTVCGGGVGETHTLGEYLKRASFVWDIQMVPTKYENDKTTFDLEWARYQFDAGGRPAVHETETLTLGEGQHETIDLVRGQRGTHNCTAGSVVIDVGAVVREDPALADAILRYDMWLTDETSGQRQVRHFVGMGRQGVPVEFGFAPLRFGVPQLAPNQIPYDLITAVLGTVRGRVLPEGGAVVSVETTRRDGMGRRDDPLNGYGAGTGSKVLEMRDGEAVRIELPPPVGSARRAAFDDAAVAPFTRADPRPNQAVVLLDGQITVNEALFFAGHRTSLVLQVKRVG